MAGSRAAQQPDPEPEPELEPEPDGDPQGDPPAPSDEEAKAKFFGWMDEWWDGARAKMDAAELEPPAAAHIKDANGKNDDNRGSGRPAGTAGKQLGRAIAGAAAAGGKPSARRGQASPSGGSILDVFLGR